MLRLFIVLCCSVSLYPMYAQQYRESLEGDFDGDGKKDIGYDYTFDWQNNSYGAGIFFSLERSACFAKENVKVKWPLDSTKVESAVPKPSTALQWVLDVYDLLMTKPLKAYDPYKAIYAFRPVWQDTSLIADTSFFVTIELAPEKIKDWIAFFNHGSEETPYASEIKKAIKARELKAWVRFNESYCTRPYEFNKSGYFNASRLFQLQDSLQTDLRLGVRHQGLTLQKGNEFCWLFINDGQLFSGTEKLRHTSIHNACIYNGLVFLAHGSMASYDEDALSFYIIDPLRGLIYRHKDSYPYHLSPAQIYKRYKPEIKE